MPSSSRALFNATKKRAQKLEAKGKPVDFKQLPRAEPDGGTTNIRNVDSAHWRRWLGAENRCLVLFNSFSEYDTIDGKEVPVWFAVDESRPLLCFAGLWTSWTSVRKATEGEITADIRNADHQAERRGAPRAPHGDAGHSDERGGARCLDARTLGRGPQAAAAVTGRCAEDRCHGGEGGWCRGGLKKEERARRADHDPPF
jgi:hypothetical protein